MSHIVHAAQFVLHHLAEPTAPPTVDTPKQINVGGIFKFFATVLGPVLLALLGVGMLARARRGDMSATMNSTAVAIVGIVFIGGAFGFMAIGGWLTDVLVK